MRILVNALSGRQGGGQTYLVNLLGRVPHDLDAEILLLAPEGLPLSPQAKQVRRLDAGPRTENPLVRAVWERTRLPRLLRELRVDILFSPGGVLAPAPAGCRTVTMFRNMIPFDMEIRRRYPPGYARVRNWLLERLMLRSMERADLTIFLARHAVEVIGRASRRAVHAPIVIPHGVSEAFFGAKVARPPGVPPSYILYASTIDVYKAQLEVVAGFARALPKLPAGTRLLLVGHEYPPYAARVRREIARLGMSDHVLVPGPAPYADMPALYRHAEVNIFASECENCPNILLEALAAGRPVLCSSTPPMPEFGGDAVLYFDPRSPQQLAERLEQVFADPALRARLAESAVKRARGYSWEESARRTWDAIAALGAPRTTGPSSRPRRSGAARILVNALSARQGGGQTYLVNLLGRIPHDLDAEILLLAPEGLPLSPQAKQVRRLDAGPRTENPLVRAVWERTRLPRLLRELRVDVLFSPGGVLAPAPGCKTVTAFQNMIPFDMEIRRRYPPGYARVRNWLLERLMLRSMERADLTIFLARNAVEVIGRASRRAVHAPVVIPHGVSEAFFETKVARPPGVPPSYILYASTIDVYKAQLEVVAGFARALPKLPAGTRLLLVGHEYPPYAARVRREIARLGMSDHVLVPGPAPYADMPALYRHAEVNIFASECENCPNILLEALAAGRPVLCSSTPPMPEFGGDAVLYFDPRSPQQLADRLEQVFADPALRARLAESAVRQARGYSWEESARRTWDAIFALGARR